MSAYRSLDITATFLQTFADRDVSAADRAAILKALPRLDDDERHPSLRVHRLHGDRHGSWSASASDALRLTFERGPDGRKQMLTCSRHYDR